jgi:hypothetical protein
MTKKWYTETRYVDTETGEALTKARLERERLDWIKTGSSHTVQDMGSYLLKIHTNEYARNPQQQIIFGDGT